MNQDEQNRQLELILKDHFINPSTPKFNNTAERFVRDRPELVEPLTQALAACVPFAKLEEKFRMSHHTILAFRDLFVSKIKDARKVVADECLSGGRLGVSKTTELLADSKDLKAVSIATGILLTKAQELSGQPTQRIEINAHIDFVAELKKLATDAKEEMKQVEGRTMEVESKKEELRNVEVANV